MKNLMKMIPFECLIPDPNLNARKSVKSVDTLTNSIKVCGLLHPIGVKPKSKTEPDGTQHYFIVYGSRRYRAIEKIREENPEAFAEIPAFEKDGTTQTLRELNLIENLDREELSPSEVADAIVCMVNSGMEQRAIAKHLGRPQSWVSYHHKVATKLGPDAKKVFEAGDITFEQALHVADVPEAEQAELVEKIKSAGTRSEARQIAKDGSNQADTKRKYSNKNRPTAKNLVKYVQDASFDGQSPTTNVKDTSFYNGVAAGLQVALGIKKMEEALPAGSFLDTDFTTTPGLAPKKKTKS